MKKYRYCDYKSNNYVTYLKKLGVKIIYLKAEFYND